MQISDEHFKKFKELTRQKIGEEEYNKMSEQELLDSAIKLVTLVEAVYKPINNN